MVLLFLGVVFLLVGFQAMGSGGNSDEDEAATTTAVTTTTTDTPPPSPTPVANVDVQVYNISQVLGAADRTATQLRDAGWNVTETGNLDLPNVAATTVYFSDAAGEHEAADEVGKLLDNAPVEPRTPEVADKPPGVIVVVTG